MCDFIEMQLTTHLITFISHRAGESSLPFDSLKEKKRWKKLFNVNRKKSLLTAVCWAQMLRRPPPPRSCYYAKTPSPWQQHPAESTYSGACMEHNEM